MRSWTLERKLAAGAALLFGVPTAVALAVLVVLHRRGAFADADRLLLVVVVGLPLLMGALALVVEAVGRGLARSLVEVQRGTEVMASVDPDHRVDPHAAGALGALVEEINRLADHLREAREGLAAEVGQATRELELERGKLSAVLGGLGEGVVVATADGVITLANERARELLGAPPTGALGQSLFEFVDRDKVGHFLARLGAADTAAERFTLHPPSGAVVQVGMTPFLDRAGRLVGFVLAMRDVSESARTEEERRHRLTEALYDVRGPLASIRSLSESVLADGAALSGPVRLRPLLVAIHAEAVRLSDLVSALAGPDRLDAARAPEHFEEVDAADLLGLVRRRHERERPGELLVSSPPPGIGVRAEVTALATGLARLLEAAAALRRPGGAVGLGASRRGGVLQLEVWADGSAPLAAVEAALDERLAGPGGSTTTTREVARRHAGEAWAATDGLRVAFRINLPVAEPSSGVRTDTASTGPRYLVGAGLRSGDAAAARQSPRPALYDFSFFEAMERHVGAADRERLLAEISFVAFDTETTGFEPDRGDRVISLAGVRIRGGQVRPGEVFDALVHPGRPVPPASARLHGITDPMVATAPPLGVVLPAFLRFASGSALVGHDVWFDLRFLERACAELGLPAIAAAHPVLDVRLLSRVVHPVAADGNTLEAAAGRLGVPVRARHSALGDALTTAETFARLLVLLDRRGIRTLGEALAAAACVGPGAAGPAGPGGGGP